METDVPTIVAEVAPPAELQSVVAVITQFKILRFIACNVCSQPGRRAPTMAQGPAIGAGDRGRR